MKVETLFKNEIKEYLRDPNHCPLCDSVDIRASEFDPDTKSQRIECNYCSAIWNDVYELKTIEIIES